MEIVWAVLIVVLISIIGAVILVLASRYMQVEEDPRLEEIQQILPGVNCGACGYAGCADYAAALLEGAPGNLCIPGGADVAGKIADILGSAEAGDVKRQMAIVACQGTSEHIRQRYDYTGIQTCSAASALYGGVTSCSFGCLGFGDCVDACRFDAIVVRGGVARVLADRCTGCGACEEACPKRVIWIREVSEKPVVMCANHQRGALVGKACSAGCIGCKKCETVCPEKAIKVRGNVARIDLDKCIGCRACVNICPVKAIAVPKVV